MRRLVLLLTTLLFPALARAEPVAVTATPVEGFSRLGFSEDFGALHWRGGLTLESGDEAFGGLSGLVLDENCERLIAVSDQGRWFTARLDYRDGRLSGLRDAALNPVRDSKGNPQRDKLWGDSEAVTRLADGRFAVAFERKVRFGAYDFDHQGVAARFAVIPHPRDIDRGPENGEVEAFGQLPFGDFIAIAERHRDSDGNTRAWLWRGKQTTAFALTRFGSYNVTDLAILPDGSVLTMERRFNKSSLPGMAIRHFDPTTVKAGDVIDPQLVLEATVPFQVIDNMEGIAICSRDGETRVTILSDNNFNPSLQSTLLLQFSYAP